MGKLDFTKMHGCGNDYVYIDCFKQDVEAPELLARTLSDRHKGVGGDGVILICPSETADAKMRMFNADGSEGRMCGNGVRCVAEYLFRHGYASGTAADVETLSGVKHIVRREPGLLTVDMGAPELAPEKIPVTGFAKPVVNELVEVNGGAVRMTCVSMGNPHAIVFMNGVNDLDIEKIGPKFEHHSCFPNRTNTEFVEILDRKNVFMRVWERGTGETLACGTGCCATAVACVLNGLTDDEITVKLLGGELHIRWDRKANLVYMTGPAKIVFEGEVDPDSID